MIHVYILILSVYRYYRLCYIITKFSVFTAVSAINTAASLGGIASTSFFDIFAGESFIPVRTHFTVIYTEPLQYISKRNADLLPRVCWSFVRSDPDKTVRSVQNHVLLRVAVVTAECLCKEHFFTTINSKFCVQASPTVWSHADLLKGLEHQFVKYQLIRSYLSKKFR